MPVDYPALQRVLTERRSIRRFLPNPVPVELQERLWDAALCAPSAGNRQSYRLLIVDSESVRVQMASAVRSEIEAMRQQMTDEYRKTVDGYFQNFLHFEHAPLVVAPIHRAGPDILLAVGAPNAPTGGVSARSELETVSSVAAAITHLLLACHGLGLGACWMTGPLIASRQLEAILGVPHGWTLSALVPIGYPDETPTVPPRRTREHLVRRVVRPDTKPSGRE